MRVARHRGLTRTRLALDEARRTPLELVRGDAVEDVGELIASLPRDATAVVTADVGRPTFARAADRVPRGAVGGLETPSRGVDQRGRATERST